MAGGHVALPYLKQYNNLESQGYENYFLSLTALSLVVKAVYILPIFSRFDNIK